MKNDWYVAIFGFGPIYYPFYAANSKDYKDFKKLAAKNNIEIAAEVFNVPGEVVDKISDEGLIRKIADRLDTGEKFNVQEELEKIVKA